VEAIVQAKNAVSGFGEMVEYIREIRDLPITNDEEKEFAAEGLRLVKEEYRMVEAQRKKLTEPLNGVVKEINDMLRPDREACLEAERAVKQKIAGYLEQKQLDNERALQAAASAATPAQAQTALATVSQVEAPRGVSVRYMWVATVTDASLIPREYLMPDMPRILDAVRASDGKVEIPGINIHQEPSVSSRRL
jgi:cell division septation protein DedD